MIARKAKGGLHNEKNRYNKNDSFPADNSRNAQHNRLRQHRQHPISRTKGNHNSFFGNYHNGSHIDLSERGNNVPFGYHNIINNVRKHKQW